MRNGRCLATPTPMPLLARLGATIRVDRLIYLLQATKTDGASFIPDALSAGVIPVQWNQRASLSAASQSIRPGSSPETEEFARS